MILQNSYYRCEETVSIAQDLLGKLLVTNFSEGITAGFITETEAYRGIYDRASHAYNGRLTKRTGIMYREGGYAYIYLCYGIHHLFNVVTAGKNVPHAVLIRSVYAVQGLDIMKQRIAKPKICYKHTNGPGKLSKALGIHSIHSGKSLVGNKIWIEDVGKTIISDDICISERIGVDYAGEDAKLPYRFFIEEDHLTKYFGEKLL